MKKIHLPDNDYNNLCIGFNKEAYTLGKLSIPLITSSLLYVIPGIK